MTVALDLALPVLSFGAYAFIEEIRKYAAIKELDEVVLNRLIKKIMIGEVQKVDGQKIQEVKIIYNFVGEISA